MSNLDSLEPNTESHSFINAKVLQSRMLNESATSFPSAAPNIKEPRSVQIRTDASSNFTVGLDNTENPTEMMLEITFKATLKTEETEKLLVEYESKHAAQFKIFAWTGFSDWMDVPSDALTPYFLFISDIAIRRGEATLLELGFRGVRLPIADNFNDALPEA